MRVVAPLYLLYIVRMLCGVLSFFKLSTTVFCLVLGFACFLACWKALQQQEASTLLQGVSMFEVALGTLRNSC